MILVDSSVWIDHLHAPVAEFIRVQSRQQLACHPLVICELALGSLSDRTDVLKYLGDLPSAPIVTPDEVLALVERRRLWGRGIGVVDAHLLASVVVGTDFVLWTRDRRLHKAATELGVAHEEH
jgi:predicted nucleic acid-binding protein